ncbi:S41 family peptidase [Corallococcus sp. M34]|uniref:S41 family peptidase n=1 Tax=Citreicoccus inhibens TaxID=2849499 RepID=UPI001C217DE7|nr:S41 family peptidase [Citreicoccus inhibens]MBU8894045.1 S41 family peptidase [Citreicoccus inhibens]
MRGDRSATWWVGVLSLSASVAWGQPGPRAAQPGARAERAGPRPLSVAERSAALDAIVASLRASYVFPEKVPGLVERLTQARKAGRYDGTDPVRLGELVTEDLVAASGDHHLYLGFEPPRYEDLRKEAARGESADAEFAFWRERAARDHHGLAEQRILPGNIRYLRISAFEWVRDQTGAVYDEALRFLKDGDAVIIDLRGNGGGSHGAVRYLVSHFLDEDTLEMTFLERSKPDEQSRALGHLPAGRLKGKPLYVLIDGDVASAAEAFAYDVQQFKLGELVGAKTMGAANNNQFVPIAPGFVLSVSMGRPVHAVSHTNWEGVGITPTVEAIPFQALEVAQSLALKRLAQTPGLSPEVRAGYAWAQAGAEARLHPVELTTARIQELTGQYGDMEVKWREGAMWMSRPDRPLRRLAPMTADGWFTVDGVDALRVHITPKAVETQWLGAPAPRVYPRT